MYHQGTVAVPSGRDAFNQFQYDDLAVKSQDVYANTKYDILESYLGGQRNLNILNVGCGSGELSLRLATKGHRVVGIDIEPAHIDLARRNAGKMGPSDCTFIASAVEEFQSETLFDCLMSTDVLEHIEDDRAAFARMMRLLRPGGLVLLTVPAGPWLFGYHDEQLGHFRRYSKRTLRCLVEADCDILTIRHFGFTLVPVCLMYSKWLRKPYPVAESADTSRRPFRALALRTLLRLDRWMRMPFGTSLLMMGSKPLAA